ncbi:hypothetical protein ACQKMI_24285 [Lysinibacillus sp. NPDC097214]|uniref:hypothetical protein n=1 Tax=Lysinibacillus sp. NPDC097214 TaxID=3390584 RepID=UPI003CFBE959
MKKVLTSKKWKGVFIALGFAFLLFALPGFDHAMAAKNSASDAASSAGITAQSDDGKALIDQGKSWVYILMGFGFVVIAGCLIMAGVKLAASSQAQKRVDAFWWVGGAFIGAIIVYNAFKLLGFAIGAGGTSGA